jgi:serine/threonine protein kinase
LELVDGASLGTRIGYMVDDDILSISRDVLLALNYLHNLTPEATVHLDIKPTNILVHGIRSSAKICDFGSARSLSPATDKIFLGGVSGTPAWMAPEVVERRPVGRPADVYSFGVVLWQMLSGEMPYNGFGLGQVCKAICQGKHPMLKQEFDDRLPGIIDLARSCWEFEADKRPNCCRLLVELDVVKENMALRSIPTPPPPPPMPHPQRPQERVPAFGSPERPRQAPPAGYGFSVTSDDLEVQRSRLKTPKQLVDKETSTNGLAQVMQKVIVERRESWRDSSGGEEEQCSSPWSPTEEEEISVSLRGQ